jgi:hypothetical protein
MVTIPDPAVHGCDVAALLDADFGGRALNVLGMFINL